MAVPPNKKKDCGGSGAGDWFRWCLRSMREKKNGEENLRGPPSKKKQRRKKRSAKFWRGATSRNQTGRGRSKDQIDERRRTPIRL